MTHITLGGGYMKYGNNNCRGTMGGNVRKGRNICINKIQLDSMKGKEDSTCCASMCMYSCKRFLNTKFLRSFS